VVRSLAVFKPRGFHGVAALFDQVYWSAWGGGGADLEPSPHGHFSESMANTYTNTPPPLQPVGGLWREAGGGAALTDGDRDD